MPNFLDEKIAQAPQQPGVYLMLNAAGKVLYVGKAKNLHKRVASYFRRSSDRRALTQLLVERVRDIDYMVTATEAEALLLENTLIKKEKPKYNVELKDSKDYVSLGISIQHEFPRLTVVRRPKKDGALYFGPYASAWATKKMARYLYRLFPIRSCSDHVFNNRSRPCLLYQIKLCSAPCVGKISKRDHDVLVDQIRLFLKGHTAPLLKQLRQDMQTASEATHYEKAASLRDRIRAIQSSMQQQHVVFHDMRDMDVVGYAKEDSTMAVVILTIREGKIIGNRQVLCSIVDTQHIHATLETILSQHYLGAPSFVPPKILLPLVLEGRAALAAACREKVTHAVQLLCPRRGEKQRLVKMANANAKLYLQQMLSTSAQRSRLMQQMRTKFGLSADPVKIEAYDISNVQGSDAVGSQVTFIMGEPAKELYRKYRIRSIKGANDFAMFKEVLGRRFQGADAKEHPGLILIDGGKGQLNAACEVMQELKRASIPIAAIAKIPSDAATKGITTDRIFVPGRKNPLALQADSSVLRLLQRLRDEAHRFALAYHHKRRKLSTIKSQLQTIPGVGPVRLKQLLKHFGSVARTREASLRELKALPFLNDKLAQTVFDHLHKQR